jgi:hypothetical protein
MQALTTEDLLPLEEYAGRRREFFESHGRYLDRYRRVQIGPQATVLFENRQTIWFRLHEVLRIARLTEPARVQQELDVYNHLLPGRNRLQAALVISIADESKLAAELAPWRELRGANLCLHVGTERYTANLYTCRPEDRCVGTAHWVQFVLNAAGRELLADHRQPAWLALTLPAYLHDSPPLSDDVRASLIEDLKLSDRDP